MCICIVLYMSYFVCFHYWFIFRRKTYISQKHLQVAPVIAELPSSFGVKSTSMTEAEAEHLPHRQPELNRQMEGYQS